jgi:hypothetical protein
MRRGLLALLALLGASSIASAQVQFVPPPGLTIQTAAAARVSPDDVVTRLMTFDHNNDGRVAIGELSERMRPLVARGDRNGDEALDRAELQALAVAPRAEAPAQTGRAFARQGGYSFGDDVGLSSKTHIEGALEDLRLASDTKERALPIIRRYVDQVETAAMTELTSRLEALMSLEQVVTLTTALKNPERQLTQRSANGETRVIRMTVGGDLKRRVEGMGLVPENNLKAQKAIDDFKSRLRLGSEADRAQLLVQLKDVLSPEEREDYGAALARRPVVASGPQVFAFNDVVRRAQETFGVVRPAVLIEPRAPVTIISR